MNASAAVAMILAEHAALTRVLQAMHAIVTQAKWRDRTPDFEPLRAMLFYIDEFPERLHHVKESAMLFSRLRELDPSASALLDRLDHEHTQGECRARELQHRLTAWQWLGESRRDAFEHALRAYTAFYMEHMRVEETEVLPLAERVLGDDDWRMLERAFGMHCDALTQTRPQAQYDKLFQCILAAMPNDDKRRINDGQTEDRQKPDTAESTGDATPHSHR
jgi:hemerythrin-like domain-containing protein